MIIKFSIFGLLIVLIVVLVLTMRREPFEDSPIPPPPSSSVPPPPRSPPSQTTVSQMGPNPSDASDTKASTLVPSSIGAAGPAPVAPVLDTNTANAAMATVTPLVSDVAVNANAVKNQSDLLASIQKVIHNELMANRAMDASVHETSQKGSSPSLTQGREHQAAQGAAQGVQASSAHAAGCSGDAEGCHGECMDSRYIKKDSIPCWGCSLDY